MWKSALIWGLALVLGAGIAINHYVGEVAAGIVFNPLTFDNLQDGTYVGEHDARLVYAKVQVTVEGGRVTAIDLMEHRHGRGQRGERILEVILQKQSLQVDHISGATISSKTIAKAVENSLIFAN
ncbi:MAG: FMN-binding protein [Limnochordia bacterium]|jgi:uncharacterized protein with FMN-binding domain